MSRSNGSRSRARRSGSALALLSPLLALAATEARADGVLESVACDAGVKGWAASASDEATPIDVKLTFDAEAGAPGVVLHPFLASLPRADLCAEHGCDHGFEVTLPLGLHDGLEHTVRAYTAEEGSGVITELSMSPKTFTCPLVLPAGARRRIADEASLGAWRFSPFWDVIDASDGIVSSYTEGAPLPATPEVVHAASAPDDVFLLDVTAKKATVKRAFSGGAALLAWDLAAPFTEERADDALAKLPSAAAMRPRPFVLRGADDTLWLVDDDPQGGASSPATSSGAGGGGPADDGPDDGGGCSCAVVGATAPDLPIWLLIAVPGLVIASRRRSHVALGAACVSASLVGASAVAGCDTKQTDVRVAQSSATTPASASAAPVPSEPVTWDVTRDPSRPIACAPGVGRDYEVGPGKKIENLVDVPWESLGAGDSVRIHPKPGGYHEKIFLSQAGTEKEPLHVCGVPGPKGELPVIDGENAKSRPAASHDYTYAPQQDRGLFIVSLDTKDRYGFKPHHVLIENLELKHAHPDYGFTGSAGDQRHYLDNAAGLYIERGEDIVVRGCVIDDNANGFFLASGNDEQTLSRRVVFERNHVYGNGTTGARFDRHHNIYSEAIGMIYQFNRVGPLRAGAGGSALKDRSAGTIVRYNWIEGGSRSLDLVEAEESWQNQKNVPEHNDAWVYGNVILAGPEGASNVVHFGGDNGFEDTYRNGTLYFYGNTVVIRADQSKRWRTALFELATNAQTVDARNNVVFVTSETDGAEPTSFTLMNQYGVGNFFQNLMSPSADFSDGAETKGRVTGTDKIARIPKGQSPFKALARSAEGKQDLHLASGASAPSELAKGAKPLDFEYVPHQSGKARAPKMLGAFE